jgi:hypothetical protein
MAKPAVRDGSVILVVDNEHAAKRVRDYLDDLTKVIHGVAGPCTVLIEVRDDAPESAPQRRRPAAKASDDDESMDIEDVKKLPTVTAKSTEDELLEAFPDSKFVDKDA